MFSTLIKKANSSCKTVSFYKFPNKALWKQEGKEHSFLLLITKELSMTAQNMRNTTATVDARLLSY